MNATISDLLTELVEAFPPRPLSPDLFAASKRMWSNYFRDKAFEAGCRGLPWNALDPAFVETHHGALTWMSPDAFAAFVPAFLASLVREDTQNMLPSMVLWQLTRREGFEDDFDARAARLTASQREVIVHVLESLAPRERYARYRKDIEAALASWRAARDIPFVASDATTSSPAPAAGEPARPTVGLLPETQADPALADLLAAIIAAFPPRPIAPDVLADPTRIWMGNIRAAEFEAGTRGRAWNTLIPEFVEIHNWALHYMTPEAFVALVPAYLAWLLRGDTLDEEPVIAALTRGEGREKKFDARAARLSTAQRAVIVRVLEALTRLENLSDYRAEIEAALASWRAVPAGPAPQSE